MIKIPVLRYLSKYDQVWPIPEALTSEVAGSKICWLPKLEALVFHVIKFWFHCSPIFDHAKWRLFIQPMGWRFFVDTIEVANDDILSLSLSYTITICDKSYKITVSLVICVNIYQQPSIHQLRVQLIRGCDLLPGPSFAIAPRRRSWLCWHLSGRFPQRTVKTQLIAPPPPR